MVALNRRWKPRRIPVTLPIFGIDRISNDGACRARPGLSLARFPSPVERDLLGARRALFNPNDDPGVRKPLGIHCRSTTTHDVWRSKTQSN